MRVKPSASPGPKKPIALAHATRGERVIAFIEKYCVTPEGTHIGKPIRLEPFQKRFLLEIYDNPHGTHTAILSIARKNGKTALIACILLVHLDGPEALRNSQIVSGAMSREQASIVFNLAVKMVNMSPVLSPRIKVFPSAKKLLGLARNVEYRALAAEGKTAHGLSPVLAILDELGQVKGPTDPFIEAIETAQGAYDNPLKIIISTQAPSDADMLSLLIDAPDDPHIVKHVYSAPPEADLDDEDAWREANPALGLFRSIDDVAKQCAKALSIPTFEPAFRNLILNQRVDMASPFVAPSVWKANGAAPAPIGRQRVWGGLDLSEVNDLTALVLLTENYDVHPTFWLPEFGLREKAKSDRVPYDVWQKQGFLLTTPGKSVQYQHIARYLRGIFDQFDVQAIGFDRYNMRHLRPWLEREGFTDVELTRFIEFGQGTASMTPALRDLEVVLVEGEASHGMHPILTMCAANARVVGDSGARKFDKRTARGRIDGMVALAIAIGVMPQRVDDEKGTIDDMLNDPVMF